ncbi:MAG TPA: tryptophan synthase subunit alpha [Acetobacteraceae bacterium]|jgi:tryptophan synthase alpha chain|nr:tryptophan synthase subunit alpha [Acetobacteraceae bacterium]
MGRIAARFAKLRAEGRGALIPFLEAFDPDRATAMEILRGMPGAGADLIEIGVPFTDPAADGPTIQLAGQRGLRAGGSLEGALGMVREFRGADAGTPIVLMGYFNPILSYGVERFCADAASAGVDGLIVVDVPPEEADEIEPQAQANGLDVIRLVAPTTDEARLPRVLSATSGFVYYVAITGITGTRSASAESLAAAMPRLRRHTDLPIAIGFGVRTPEQAAQAATHADAAVVASALIEILAANLDATGAAKPGAAQAVLARVAELAEAVRAARKVVA